MRKKGLPKTGGRVAGTPNKISGTMKEFIINILEGNKKQFEENMKNLPPKDFVCVYEKLLQYIVPKQQNLITEDDLPHVLTIKHVGVDGKEIHPDSIDCDFPQSEDEVDLSRA